MTRHHLHHHYSLWHPHGETFRTLPRHGEPVSIFEWLTQRTIRSLACFPIYAMLAVVLTFVTYVWIAPLLEG